jgi:hypothetical protein
MANNFKSGQNVFFNNDKYLFLGYIDYKRKRSLIADKYGNKLETWTINLI